MSQQSIETIETKVNFDFIGDGIFTEQMATEKHLKLIAMISALGALNELTLCTLKSGAPWNRSFTNFISDIITQWRDREIKKIKGINKKEVAEMTQQVKRNYDYFWRLLQPQLYMAEKKVGAYSDKKDAFSAWLEAIKNVAEKSFDVIEPMDIKDQYKSNRFMTFFHSDNTVFITSIPKNNSQDDGAGITLASYEGDTITPMDTKSMDVFYHKYSMFCNFLPMVSSIIIADQHKEAKQLGLPVKLAIMR